MLFDRHLRDRMLCDRDATCGGTKINHNRLEVPSIGTVKWGRGGLADLCGLGLSCRDMRTISSECDASAVCMYDLNVYTHLGL